MSGSICSLDIYERYSLPTLMKIIFFFVWTIEYQNISLFNITRSSKLKSICFKIRVLLIFPLTNGIFNNFQQLNILCKTYLATL